MIDIDISSIAGSGKDNEDYVLHTEVASDVSLIIVCDGMGGLTHGADAAKIVAQSISEYITQHYPAQTPEVTIINALNDVNDAIREECDRRKSKMGSSIGVVLIADGLFYFSWLGDVRIYHVHDGETELLSTDHLAIADNHSFLSRCINGKAFRFKPEVNKRPFSVGEELIIATDGYYLCNDVNSHTTNSPIVADDDSTIVRIRLIGD